MRFSRAAITLVILAATLGLCLGLAATAFAADGVRVIPSPLLTSDRGQLGPAVSGDYLAYEDTNPVADLSDDSSIALKYLGDSSDPFVIPTPVGYKDQYPAILSDSGTIYVIWVRTALTPPYANHLMIWKGAYGPSPAAGPTFQPEPGYPQQFVTGTDGDSALPWQWAPSIGLANMAGGVQHVVAAWEDSRDTMPQVPQIYWVDLTETTSWDPASVGNVIDSTDFLGRGQHLPTVGATGIYWLDERLSWWNDGDLTDTAVWRFDPVTNDVAPYFTDLAHTYDNGRECAPQMTADGALWLRTGAYGSDVYAPFIKPVSGSGRTLSPAVDPWNPATFTRAGATSTGVVLDAMHANSAASTDRDVFYYDSSTGVQTPVCDRSVAVPAGQDYRNDAYKPVISDSLWQYRVIWMDRRDSTGEDSTDAKLYEAFVPTVIWSLRPSVVLNLGALRSTVTVRPDFTGESVKLQRVTPVKKLGRTYYQPMGRGYLATATMVAGSPNSNSSVATFKWKPGAKGTYYLRMWFPGASKYTYDGQTVATGKQVAVPTVGNYSKVVKLTVK